MKLCESCSYPMKEKEDFSMQDENSKYCKYCAPKGELKPREEIRQGWINALMHMEKISAFTQSDLLVSF